MLAVPTATQSPSPEAASPSATSSYSRRRPSGSTSRERPDHAALDRAPQPVEVDQVGLVELADEHAAVHLVDQQALVRQQPEGLAQRVAGDPEDHDQLLLGQVRPGRQVALGDPPAQDVGHPLRGAAAGQPAAVGGEGGEGVGRCRGHAGSLRAS